MTSSHSSWRFINIHVGKTKFNFFTLTNSMYASSLYRWHGVKGRKEEPFFLTPIFHFHPVNKHLLSLWCSGYHYCMTSFNMVSTQALRRFKSCSRHVGDSVWWGSLTMVPAGDKAKHLSSVNHTTKTINHSSSPH